MADSPNTVPSASTRPTVPGTGSSGNSSRAPNTVVVESNPGNDAILTATISSWAHSFVESGQRPEITNPFRAPREWKGETPIGRSDPASISTSARRLRSNDHAVARIIKDACGLGAMQLDTTTSARLIKVAGQTPAIPGNQKERAPRDPRDAPAFSVGLSRKSDPWS